MPPTVVIVGRPNVGKSTLFNRLVGRKMAMVHPVPGVTRDRREGPGRLGDLKFRVVDTAGLEPIGRQPAGADSLAGRLRRQTETALGAADAVLFVTDAREGVTPLDGEFANWLRSCKAPVISVANKCEGRAGESGWLDAFALGFGEPVAISAEHGEGLADLFAALAPHLDASQADGDADAAPEPESEIEPSPEAAWEDAAIPLAIVGRPNVGKSTLVNRLIGDERMLTGPEPGLTREAIAIEWKSHGRTWRLIDTAGLRRQSRVAGALEKMSAADAYRAIDRAQVVVVVIDGIVGLDKQELTIASRVVEEGRALVIAVNKWDLVDDRAKALAAIEERIAESLPQARGVPVVTLSALTGRHTDRLLPAALKAYERWNRRVPTAALNRWLGRATATHTPPLVRGRPAKLRYAVQIKNRPPTFALFASQQLPDDYMRYLANSLRDKFELAGVPLRLRVRKGDNPYVKD